MTGAAIHWVVLGGAFIIFWFLALQIVMPIGAYTPHEKGESIEGGHDPGAPTRPRIMLKIAWATGAAVAMWIILYVLVLTGVLNL